jgi:hypothetical protein
MAICKILVGLNSNRNTGDKDGDENQSLEGFALGYVGAD